MSKDITNTPASMKELRRGKLFDSTIPSTARVLAAARVLTDTGQII
jgi:hypothetical protein